MGLVLGPAGSGKSTLLRNVADRLPGRVGWYRADPGDRDADTFTAALVEVVSRLGDAPLAEAGPRPQFDTLLVETVAQDARPVWLLIDDVEVLAGSAGERVLVELVDRRPPNLRLLIAGRLTPALEIPRLMVSGELHRLDADDLRFRSWEVEELFSTVYREPLSPESAATLARRVDGWAAGLQLFHLGTSGRSRSERERAVATIAASSRLVRSYLARNVLHGIGKDLRDFLVRTSTLGTLTAELCDTLMGTGNSAARLEALERDQFFVSTDDDGETFRYHTVLQAYLEMALVDELGRPGAMGLYARSARLLEDAGWTAAAVRAYGKAEEWPEVSRLLRVGLTAAPSVDLVHPKLSEALAAACPGDPGLVLADARRLTRRGSVVQASRRFEEARALAADPAFDAACADEGGAIRVWFPGPLAAQTPARGSRTAAARRLRQLCAEPGPSADHEAGLLELGLGDLLRGRLDTAAAFLAEAAIDLQASVSHQLAARLALAVTGLPDHPTDQLLADVEDVIQDGDHLGQPWFARQARGLKLALDPRTRGPASARGLLELLAACARDGDLWGSLVLCLVSGAAALHRSQPEEARTLLGEAAETAATLDAPLLGSWAVALAEHARAGACPDAATGPVFGLDVRAVGELVSRTRERPMQAARPVARAATPPPGREAAPPGPPTDVSTRVRCLGGFELLVDGRAVDVGRLRPRPRELLMLLAMNHGRRLHRERLVDVFWPGAPLSSGIRSLQVAVSHVRLCLQPFGADVALQRFGDSYSLQLVGALDELVVFEDQVRTASTLGRGSEPRAAVEARMRAVELYRGDLLPEVGPADWVLGERDRLRALAARMASEAATLAVGLGEVGLGITAARRCLSIDPYQDWVWEVLIELQERMGDALAAERSRREHARLCADNGISPLPTNGLPVPGRPSRPRPRHEPRRERV